MSETGCFLLLRTVTTSVGIRSRERQAIRSTVPQTENLHRTDQHRDLSRCVVRNVLRRRPDDTRSTVPTRRAASTLRAIATLRLNDA